jgi:hypothetical protein
MRIKEFNKLMGFIYPKNVIATCLVPFGIYIRKEWMNSKKTVNHESIHWRQQMEMGIIFFYLWYVIEYLVKIPKYRKNAYRHISFEREAYTNDLYPHYLVLRKTWSWLYYL